jgi:hypothetical protein
MPLDGIERRLTAILSADVVGYSRYMRETGGHLRKFIRDVYKRSQCAAHRRRWLTIALLLLGLSLSAAAIGQPAFVDVAADVGLVFSGDQGPPFESAPAHLELMQLAMGSGAAVGDYDGDDDLDVYLLAQTGFSNRLYRNDLMETGTPGFTDVTPADLGDLGFSRMAHFVDLDGDGWLDLLVINDDDGTEATPPSRIFRNNGDSTFTDVSAESGFRPVGLLRAGCALADFDLDGRVDIYVTVWTGDGFDEGRNLPGSNRLFRNLGGFRFEDVTDEVNLGTLARNSFAAIFTDFNGDLFPDLFVALDASSDVFYWNRAGRFEIASEEVNLTHVGNDMGIAAADFDDDGDLDLYATNIAETSRIGEQGVPIFNALNVNRLNEGGRFVDLAIERGVENTYWGWGVDFVDVENDGDLDLVAVNGADDLTVGNVELYQKPTVLLINDGTGYYHRLLGAGLDEAADSRGLVVFDYDRDGDRDLLITNMNQPVQLMENVSSAAGNWLDVLLAPPAAAIGARVYAHVGGSWKRRDVLAGGSYLAGVPTEVHFGLGEETVVSTLRIEWPDGRTQTLTDVAASQLLRVSKESGLIAVPVPPTFHPH